MIRSDNTTIQFKPATFRLREHMAEIQQYRDWLNERNIKYSFVKSPEWLPWFTAVNMRNEDAIVFRLAFGL